MYTEFKGKFHDLEMGTLPSVCVAESWVLHTISLRGTNCGQRVNHMTLEQTQISGVYTMTLNCDLDIESG